MSKFLNRVRSFFSRLALTPFEAVIGFYCLYSGLAGILNFGLPNDIFRQTIGTFTAFIFHIIYLLAGAAAFFGIGLDRRNVEAAGWISVISSILARQLVIAITVGLNPMVFNGYIYATAIIIACLVRLHRLLVQPTIPTVLFDATINTTVIFADTAGNIARWSENAELMFGYTAKEAEGQPLTLLMPNRYKEAHSHAIRRLSDGGKPHLLGKSLEVAAKHKNGKEFPIFLSLDKWTLAGVDYYVGVITKK
jgi:PAS domain S-box-containing protein